VGPGHSRDRWLALLTASAIMAVLLGLAAHVGTRVLDPRTFVNAPPFYGYWRNALGLSTLVPTVVAAVVITCAHRRYEIGWRWLLAGAVTAGLAWSFGLGVADHIGRLTYQLNTRPDYAAGLGPIGSHPGGYLETFHEAARGPSSQVIARGYPIHVQGHPPGAVLTLWALTRLGLGPIGGGIVLVWLGQAAMIVGVLSSVRRLAGEAAARAVVPFVVLLPGAVWSHTYDSFFAGVAALAIAATLNALVAPADPAVRADGAHARWTWVAWAVTGGVLFGYLGLLSYGLVLLALGPVLVALRNRRLGPLLVSGLAAITTMAIPAAWGFNWFEGLATTHHQYVTTVASIRPYHYFVWANLVITAFAVGPAAVAGFLLAARRIRATPRDPWRGAGPLVLGAVAALLLADLSGLAKAEVDRIFQPFYIWIAVAAVAMAGPIRARRRDGAETVALSLQAIIAVVLATQLRSPW